MKSYWVYMMSGRTRALYVGVTNDIERRDYEHKNKSLPGFTTKYRLDRLVWKIAARRSFAKGSGWLLGTPRRHFEEHADIRDAIEREKQIKSWRREKKVALIESLNPQWRDLGLDWHLNDPSQRSDKSLRVDPSATPQKNAAPVGMTKKGPGM